MAKSSQGSTSMPLKLKTVDKVVIKLSFYLSMRF